MTISLERLFSGESSEILLNEEFDFSAVPVQDAFPFAAPVKLTGTIEAKAQVVSLQAEAEVRYRSFCDRCAREAERVWHVPVRHILVEELQNEDDEGEYILVENRQLDLERLTLEDIYLFLPSKFLCVDDCKGVCPQCGTNLNEASCSCKKEVDPRLEALLSMLED